MARELASWREVIEPHPLTPALTGPAFGDLVEDVRRHGVKVPIAFWREADRGELLLLDGRSPWPPDVAIARIKKSDREEAIKHKLQLPSGKG